MTNDKLRYSIFMSRLWNCDKFSGVKPRVQSRSLSKTGSREPNWIKPLSNWTIGYTYQVTESSSFIIVFKDKQKQNLSHFLAKEMIIGFWGVILKPWRACIAMEDWTSSSNSTNAIPGFAEIILISLKPRYCSKRLWSIALVVPSGRFWMKSMLFGGIASCPPGWNEGCFQNEKISTMEKLQKIDMVRNKVRTRTLTAGGTPFWEVGPLAMLGRLVSSRFLSTEIQG